MRIHADLDPDPHHCSELWLSRTDFIELSTVLWIQIHCIWIRIQGCVINFFLNVLKHSFIGKLFPSQ